MKLHKYIVLILAASSLFILTSFSTMNPSLSKIKTYTIYYGEVDELILEKLSNFEMVVIEPHAFTEAQIHYLRQKGTMVLGYMSLMELEQWNDSIMEKVTESDYYLRNYQKFYIEKWDTYLMDLSKKHYQSLLLDEIKVEIVDKKLDGVFFDTIGDIDDYFSKDPITKKKLRNGYVNILKQLSSQYAELILFQNWGFETYKTTSYQYVDGIMWEGFKESRLAKDAWGKTWISYFKLMERKKKISVFTVTPSKVDAKYSKKQGFIPFINENDYYNILK